MRTQWIAVVALGLAVMLPAMAQAQSNDTAAWAAQISNDYRVVPNIIYLRANNWENKVDVYAPRNAAGPTPVVMYIHGGGWVGGNKEANVLRVLPYLEMGWAVVNVGYRLGQVSLAPAAVEDCRCALRWVIRNAKEYNFDPARIIVTGNSAGGHLALTTGMIPASAGLDRICPGTEPLGVAAVINWYGIADVADLIDGPNTKTYAVQWLGSLPDRVEVARRVSPLTYVRRDLPPILSIHGDADPVVPYQQATRLTQSLKDAGVASELFTVPGGGHGNFNREQTVQIFQTIRQFLAKHGLQSARPTN